MNNSESPSLMKGFPSKHQLLFTLLAVYLQPLGLLFTLPTCITTSCGCDMFPDFSYKLWCIIKKMLILPSFRTLLFTSLLALFHRSVHCSSFIQLCKLAKNYCSIITIHISYTDSKYLIANI